MSTRFSLCTIACALLACAALPPIVHAQTPAVVAAKDLYTSAAYDAALTALAGDESQQAQEYRALCLLALGRTDEAKRVTEALVTAHPEFTVSDEETPPRFVALLADTRRRLLPVAIRRLFSEGREKFQAKSYGEAREQLQRVLALAGDPLVKGAEEVADLGVLASGFLDLTNAAATAAAKPAPVPPREVVAPRPPAIVPPVAIRQAVPPWPRSAGAADGSITVSLRVSIGADGRVKNATVLTPTRPQFDLQLVAAAQGWVYKPGTLNGEPAAMEKVVSLVIDAR